MRNNFIDIDNTNYLMKEKKFNRRQPGEEDLLTTQERLNDDDLKITDIYQEPKEYNATRRS